MNIYTREMKKNERSQEKKEPKEERKGGENTYIR